MSKTFVSWISETVTVLSRQLVNLLRSISTPSPIQMVDKSPVGAPSVAREVRISPYERKIMVGCISCSKVHELLAACNVCGAPVCEDTIHCQKVSLNEALGLRLIYCPTCFKNR